MPTFPASCPCVMIVDDDEDCLAMSRRLVAKANPMATVITSSGGGQAVAYLLRACSHENDSPASLPTMILLDLNMPGINGFEVLGWVRRNPSLAHVKVIIMSSSESEQDLKRAAELGAHGYLIKYPDPAVLCALLNEEAEVGLHDFSGGE